VALSNLSIAGLTGALSFSVDQISKVYVTNVLKLAEYESRTIIDGFITFTHVKNYGINFGWLQMPQGDPRPQYILIAISLIVSFALLVWAVRRWNDKVFGAAIGLVVGGALGNAYDRLTLGAVTDFLNVTCCGINNPYAFNIADIAIFAGVALLLYQTRGDEARTAEK